MTIMDTTVNDIAAKIAKQAVNAIMGDIVSTVMGVFLLIAVVAGLFLLIVLFSRRRRNFVRRRSGKTRKMTRVKRKRR